MKSTKELIEQIHNEFNTASDKILEEAKRILAGPTTEKGRRLASAGFVSAKEAVVLAHIDEPLSKLIEYYQIHYPNNKFITEEMALMICKKYRLVCAPVSRYIGFVPDKNLKEVESFQIRREDKAADEMIITSAWNTGKPDFLLRSMGAAVLHRRIGLKRIPMDHADITYMRGEPFAHVDGGYIEKYKRFDRQSVMICAPKKDFKLDGLQQMGRFFTSFTTVTTPDPVVLHPCKGGYLIVTAWGEEASDEMVVNEKFN